MISAAEQHDTSHELVEDVLDQRSFASKKAIDRLNQAGGAGTVGNTISTVVYSSPHRAGDDLVR